MRTAAICDTCANYYNAKCVLYDGAYLTNIQVNTLDSLETALEEINSLLPPPSGASNPTGNVRFVGQLYLNTSNQTLWMGMVAGIPDWGLLGTISTTTTTSTTSTTTSHP